MLSKPNPVPKPTPRVVDRYRRRVREQAALKAAYHDVDLRDGGVCWITGRFTQAFAPDPRVRREHHHLKGRNIKPEWVDKPERIITVCAEAHRLINLGWLVVEGADARKVIRFHWAAHVEPKQRPFVIKSRRQSQQELG